MSTNFINLDTITGINNNGGSQNSNIINGIIRNEITGQSLVLVSNIAGPNGLINDGFISLDPTTLIIDGPLTGNGIIQISTSSTLELNGSVSTTETIQFTSNNADLILGDPAEFQGTISSFSLGNTIDFSTIAFSYQTIAVDNGNTLTISDQNNNIVAAVNFESNLSIQDLQISSDGFQGLQITAIPCFLKNTLISLKSQKKLVQDLKIGDMILTIDQCEKKIKWIGHRTYRQPYRPKDRSIFPICVSKSAFRDGVPSANLYLSPEHSVHIENFLIPIKFLVNGKSIKIIEDLPEISYFHIELNDHSIIFAEDAEVESFLDSGSRKMFENHDTYYQIQRSTQNTKLIYCSPKLETFEKASAIRHSLALRAGCETRFCHVPSESRFEGFLDEASRKVLRGWAWSPDHPFVPVNLDIFIDNGLIARITADQFREDLLEANIGNGFHGFVLSFSSPLSDLSHIIDVKLSDDRRSLTQCPLLLSRIDTATLTDVLGTRRTRKEKKKGLIIDSVWPDQNRDAGSNAILDHIRLFQKLGYDIDFRALDECLPSVKKNLTKKRICVKTQDQFPTVESLILSKESQYSFVYMHRLEIARRYVGLIRASCRDADGKPSLKVYGLADLQFLRIFREAKSKKDFLLESQGKFLLSEELLVMQQVDSVITHSRIEQNIIKLISPSVASYVVPWSLKILPQQFNFNDRKDIGFIGSFQHLPNLDALSWLLFNIMPMLWKTHPDIRLKIIGSGWTVSSLPNLDPRVDIIGYTENLSLIVQKLKITVAPLRFGAGIKGKVLDSLALGIPCVMSPCAAEGLCLSRYYDKLITDSPSDFASRIGELCDRKILNDEFSDIGYRIIQTFYSDKVVLNSMATIFDKTLSEHVSDNRITLNKCHSFQEVEPLSCCQINHRSALDHSSCLI